MPDTAVAPPPPRPGGGGVAGGGSGIGQLLRDPEHYEEISVIGNGKFDARLCLSLCPVPVLLTFINSSKDCLGS